MKNKDIDQLNKTLEEANKIADELDKAKFSEDKIKQSSELTRESILEELNEIIEEEDGVMTEDENTLFKDLGLDSFGATMFFLEADDRYNYFKGQNKEEFMKSVDWHNLRVKDIIDHILCS